MGPSTLQASTRGWLAVCASSTAAVLVWAAIVLPWNPWAPLALWLWGLALLQAATAVAAATASALTRALWRAASLASLVSAVLLVTAIAASALRLVELFGPIGVSFAALLAPIALLVVALQVPSALWGLVATRPRSNASVDGALPRGEPRRARARSNAPQRERAYAYAVATSTLLLVCLPLATGQDSFPLSSYPMFSRPRGRPALLSVVGRGEDGSAHSLPSALIGSDEVLQSKALIQRAVDAGPAGMSRLCEAIAGRLASAEAAGARLSPRPLAYVDIVERRFDPVQYFVVGPEPLEERQLHRCPLAPARTNEQGAAG